MVGRFRLPKTASFVVTSPVNEMASPETQRMGTPFPKLTLARLIQIVFGDDEAKKKQSLVGASPWVVHSVGEVSSVSNPVEVFRAPRGTGTVLAMPKPAPGLPPRGLAAVRSGVHKSCFR